MFFFILWLKLRGTHLGRHGDGGLVDCGHPKPSAPLYS